MPLIHPCIYAKKKFEQCSCDAFQEDSSVLAFWSLLIRAVWTVLGFLFVFSFLIHVPFFPSCIVNSFKTTFEKDPSYVQVW